MKDESDYQEHFRSFAKSLEFQIAEIDGFPKKKKSEQISIQKEQIAELISLEFQLKCLMWEHRNGLPAVNFFLDHISKNILDGRPYFRERQENFKTYISPAIRLRDIQSLICFSFNFRFFELISRKYQFGWEFKRLYKRLVELRQTIALTNTPLAISRAKIFHSKNKRSHLSYMDMIQVASCALLDAIDKFTPDWEKSKWMFIGVAIGRITGSGISAVGETMLHFFPRERRLLYRTYKFNARNDGATLEAMANAVNAGKDEDNSLKGTQRTDQHELSNLLSAANCLSTDVPLDEESKLTVSDAVSGPMELQPDYMNEQADACGALYRSIKGLTIFEQKVVALKGIF